MGREFELKYLANSHKIEEIQKKYGNFNSIQMKTSYYDTPDLSLHCRRWTLRQRMENGTSVCTLKTPLPDGSRGEWEVYAGSMEEGLRALCALDVPGELRTLAEKGLAETCGAAFTRLAKTIRLENAVIELALDRGCLMGSGKEKPFAEVEVELKAGAEAAAETFAGQLAQEFGLTPEKKSKHQRALEMLL